MPILRKREIENLESLSGELLQAYLDKLPAPAANISELLDFIEDELFENHCSHTLKYTMNFVLNNGLDFAKISSWLSANGGSCDCKVMKDIAPYWRAKFGDD
ncbi:MAG TPA: DUF2695 domain-containing protein [Pyrinomonadaceae bacterium]|nr:DUF2695 domain-containing protein [Pyrinomonadaceae bacterium]